MLDFAPFCDTAQSVTDRRRKESGSFIGGRGGPTSELFVL